MGDQPPNHHADYRQFAGAFGYFAGLTMIAGRGSDAGLVTELGGVGSDDVVLDIGCGPGTAARAAAGRSARVIGVDPAGPMLHLARLITRLRTPAGEIDWREAGAEDLPVDDASVSVCWSLASVHHWPDLVAGLAEVRRVVRPGGVFIALEKRASEGATGKASHGWTPAQARTFAGMLTELGFTSVQVDDHDRGRRKVVTVTSRAPSS